MGRKGIRIRKETNPSSASMVVLPLHHDTCFKIIIIPNLDYMWCLCIHVCVYMYIHVHVCVCV